MMAGTATMERPVDAKAAPVDQDVLIVGALLGQMKLVKPLAKKAAASGQRLTVE